MTKMPPWKTLAFLLACCAPVVLATDKSLATEHDIDLGWLSGHWVQATWDGDAAGRRSEEIWLPATENLLVGVNRTLDGARTRAFEFLRIEISPEGATYLASPGGRAATPFSLTEHGEHFAVFENPDHDFPKRLQYRRTGDHLEAIVEGDGKDGTPRTLTFRWRLLERSR